MDEITNISYEAMIRYFNTLSVFGYKSYHEVDKLIVLLFLEETLQNEFSYFLTEIDIKIIEKVLYNIYGATCLIPIPKVLSSVQMSGKKDVFVPRLNQDSLIKALLDDNISIL